VYSSRIITASCKLLLTSKAIVLLSISVTNRLALRTQWKELEQLSSTSGLILSLDGLAPQGSEPQLWVVRELNTGLALLEFMDSLPIPRCF
jgi:hypothetical protein